MGKMRTREEKIQARSVQLSGVRPNYYSGEVSLPVGVIALDLTRSVVVTILALILMAGLYFYLQQNGWVKILSALSKISL